MNFAKKFSRLFKVQHYTLFDRVILIFLIGISLFYLVFLIYYSSNCYFSRDDFPLFVESFRPVDHILTPLGKAHFRPIIKLHFYLHYIIGFSPFLFNLINVLLHLFSVLLLFKILLKYYSPKISLYASLLFFNIFTYNEILFWISQVQLLYCLIFSLICIHFFHEKKKVHVILFLVLASFSYELWILLPVFFIFSKGEKRTVIIVSVFLVFFNIGVIKWFQMDISSYGGLPGIEDIPHRIVFFISKTVAPFFNADHLSSVLLSFVLVVASISFYIYKRQKALLPLIFYFVPAALFLLSFYLPSRFFYYSAISIAILMAWLHSSKRILKTIGNLLILYLMIISVVLNYLDGMDYLRYSQEHKKIILQGKSISQLEEGDRIRLLNCVDEPLPEMYSRIKRGRPKLLFKRRRGIGGLIDPDILVDFLLFRKGLRALPVEKSQDLKIVVFGSGRLVSDYSFEVQKR